METSEYFKRAMYQEQSPAAADYFEERTASLFVNDSLQSWVEVFANNLPNQKEDEMRKSLENRLSLDVKYDSVVTDSDRSQTAAHDGQQNNHNGFAIEPGLNLRKLSHKEDLRRFIKARPIAVHFRSTQS